jgi:RNA polymerase sigma-70 factor (ECF subfamily)
LLSESDQVAVICGLQKGERSAWTRLYEAYSVDVWRYVARLVGSDASVVADVVQEVFLAAAGSARQFDPQRGSLWGWLAGIAHRQVAAYWRQASRRARLQALLEARALEVQHLLDDGQSEHWLEQRVECADLVRAVLAELPPDYAALLSAALWKSLPPGWADRATRSNRSSPGLGASFARSSNISPARRCRRCARERLP